jgi:hypothetical protein
MRTHWVLALLCIAHAASANSVLTTRTFKNGVVAQRQVSEQPSLRKSTLNITRGSLTIHRENTQNISPDTGAVTKKTIFVQKYEKQAGGTSHILSNDFTTTTDGVVKTESTRFRINKP